MKYTHTATVTADDYDCSEVGRVVLSSDSRTFHAASESDARAIVNAMQWEQNAQRKAEGVGSRYEDVTATFTLELAP